MRNSIPTIMMRVRVLTFCEIDFYQTKKPLRSGKTLRKEGQALGSILR
jgi:hypothetical protein